MFRFREHEALSPLRRAYKTPPLKFGDVVRIEMKDAGRRSIFGAIEQSLERYAR